jgi:hypothetical protein
MSKPKNARLRRYWTTTVTGVASVAVASAASGYLLPFADSKTYDVINTAAIVESSTTFGISEGAALYWSNEADINKTLDTLQAMGVDTVRIGIPWAGVEQIKGKYNWTQVDRMINAAAARGMGVLATINHSPLWAGLPPGSAHPTDPKKWADYLDRFSKFSKAAAQRYNGKVSAYEIWNEPNGFMFWNPVSPEAYTQLLKAGYTAIKDPNDPLLDPSVKVIGGVVAAGLSIGSLTMDPVTFVKRMYKAGAKGYFDALSFHPYHTKWNYSYGIGKANYPATQLAQIRKEMQLRGDGNLKVWITEYGLSTVPGKFTQAQQAAYIEDLVRALQKVNGVGPIFIYTTRDEQTGSTDVQDNYGIFLSDWTPKLAAGVVTKLIEEFGQTHLVGLALAQPNVNPVSALVQQLAQTLVQAINIIPNLISQVASVITNVLETIFRAQPVTTAAAPPGDNLPFAAGADVDASRSADPDSARAASQGGEVDEGLGDTNNLAEGDALPAGEELKPTVEKPPVVEKTVEPDLELSKVGTDNDGKTADELKNDELKTDNVTTDGDVETAADKPADGTVTNGSVTTPKENGDNPVNKPDPDAGDDADSEGDDGSGGAES